MGGAQTTRVGRFRGGDLLLATWGSVGRESRGVDPVAREKSAPPLFRGQSSEIADRSSSSGSPDDPDGVRFGAEIPAGATDLRSVPETDRSTGENDQRRSRPAR